MSWLTRIRALGRVTEPAGARPPAATEPPGGVTGSLQIRHVDAGSCNGCEIEIGGAFSPVYDAERFGARLVASPRHADALLVTGVVTRNMAEPLRNTLRPRRSPARSSRAGTVPSTAGCSRSPTRRWGRRRGGSGRCRDPRLSADARTDPRRTAVGDRPVSTLTVSTPDTTHHQALPAALSGTATAGIGAAGVGIGLAGVFGTVPAIRIDWLVPLLGVQLRIDALGGFFMALTGAVAVAAGLY